MNTDRRYRVVYNIAGRYSVFVELAESVRDTSREV